MNRMHVLAAAALIAAGPAVFAQTAIDQKNAVFPITITQPGSYKLTSNLVVPAGKNGIIVNAPNVTLDLNGFTVGGPVTCSAPGACNAASNGNYGVQLLMPNAVLRNGTVMGFAGTGVLLVASATLEDLMVTQNTEQGIYGGYSLHGAIMTRVKARLNRANGFWVFGSTLTDCVATGNGQNGYYINQSALIDSFASGNAAQGVFGGSMAMLRGTRGVGNTGGNFGGNYLSAGGNLSDWTMF